MYVHSIIKCSAAYERAFRQGWLWTVTVNPGQSYPRQNDENISHFNAGQFVVQPLICICRNLLSGKHLEMCSRAGPEDTTKTKGQYDARTVRSYCTAELVVLWSKDVIVSCLLTPFSLMASQSDEPGQQSVQLQVADRTSVKTGTRRSLARPCQREQQSHHACSCMLLTYLGQPVRLTLLLGKTHLGHQP